MTISDFDMKEHSTKTMEGYQPAKDESRKLSLALSLVLPLQKGLQKNLLVNSLASKLKQHRNVNTPGKENEVNETKIKRIQRSVVLELEKTAKSTSSIRNKIHSSESQRFESAESSLKSANNKANEFKWGNRRVGSTSDQGRWMSARKGSFLASTQRSNSDEHLGRDPVLCDAERLTTASPSFFHSNIASAVAFEWRGADYTVKVVKRDGIFQPIDKYAPNRQMAREFGQGERGIACDYELFTLPLSAENTNGMTTDNRGHVEMNEQPVKVSWSKVMSDTDTEVVEGLEHRPESISTSVAPNKLTRVFPDTMAFRRPIYSSGKSRVKSIGLKWQVPSVTPDREELVLKSPSGKPMWSWLVTNKAKQIGRFKTVGHHFCDAKDAAADQCSLSRTTSTFDVRIQHSRDLHPVSTAMEREGTSVTKTRWQVPSSASSFDYQRVAVDHLESIRRQRTQVSGNRRENTFKLDYKSRGIKQNNPRKEDT